MPSVLTLTPVRKAEQLSPAPLTAAEKRLASLIRGVLDKVADQAHQQLAARFLTQHAGPEVVLGLLDFGTFIQQFAPVRDQLAHEIAASGTGYGKTVGIKASFASVDPNVVKAANLQAGNLVQGVIGGVRESVRRVVTTALATQQLTVKDVASLLRAVVPVPAASANAIANAWTKRYEALVAGGYDHDRAKAAADKLSAKMSERAVRSRSMTIARTEVMRAQNTGRYLTWQEGAKQGLVRPDSLKEWIATGEGNRHGGPCEVCGPLDGTKVPWDGTFPGGFAMPPAHPRCRCTAVLRPPETPQVDVDAWLAQARREKEQAQQEPQLTPSQLRAKKLQDKWLGKPAPTPPTLPVKAKVDTEKVVGKWAAEVEARYFRFAGKPFSVSLNYPKFMEVLAAEKGRSAALDLLVRERYVTDEQAKRLRGLWEQIDDKRAAADRVFANKMKRYEGSLRQYQYDLKNWRKVNGVKAVDLKGMAGATVHHDDEDGVWWANRAFKVVEGMARSAVRKYTGSSFDPWNKALRAAASTGIPAGDWGPWTTRADRAMQVSPVPEDVVVRRGTTWLEFALPDGRRTSDIPPPDPMSLIGTVQVQRGYMSTSVGKTPAFSSKPVWLNIRVPKGYGATWCMPFSDYPTERELLIDRNARMMIHNVYRKDGRWVVDCEIVPPEVPDADLSLLQPKTEAVPL